MISTWLSPSSVCAGGSRPPRAGRAGRARSASPSCRSRSAPRSGSDAAPVVRRTRRRRPRRCRRRRADPYGLQDLVAHRLEPCLGGLHLLAAREERDEQTALSVEHHRPGDPLRDARRPVGRPLLVESAELLAVAALERGYACVHDRLLDRQPSMRRDRSASSRRPSEGLGTSRPVGEEPPGTITDGTGMVNEGRARRTTLTRGGLA
jgi:hypothetical protein